MKTLKQRLTELEKKVTNLFNMLANKNIIPAKQPEDKSNLVDAQVKLQMADELTKTKVQLYLAKNETITKAARELRELLTIKLGNNECEIQYKADTGEPFVYIKNFRGYSIDTIKLELDEVRKLKQWLTDIGM